MSQHRNRRISLRSGNRDRSQGELLLLVRVDDGNKTNQKSAFVVGLKAQTADSRIPPVVVVEFGVGGRLTQGLGSCVEAEGVPTEGRGLRPGPLGPPTQHQPAPTQRIFPERKTRTTQSRNLIVRALSWSLGPSWFGKELSNPY